MVEILVVGSYIMLGLIAFKLGMVNEKFDELEKEIKKLKNKI